VRLFEGHGLISAYHSHHGEKQGAETRPTYFFYRHQDKPFHIDDVFVPKDWKLGSVEVGSFPEWGHLSDHVPVVVDVSIGGSVKVAAATVSATANAIRWAEEIMAEINRRWPSTTTRVGDGR
jgi:hypothetical protein